MILHFLLGMMKPLMVFTRQSGLSGVFVFKRVRVYGFGYGRNAEKSCISTARAEADGFLIRDAAKEPNLRE